VGNDRECTPLSDLRRQFLLKTHGKTPTADPQRKRSNLINIKAEFCADFPTEITA